LGYLGLEAGKANLNELTSLLRSYGLKLGGVKEVEVKVRDRWVKFVMIEVYGFIEGLGKALCDRYGCLSFEWGGHTILGEVSAKLWHEAVKVYFPEGGSELVPVMVCDGFLSLRIPTEQVKGVNGTISISGTSFELPLSLADLTKIVLSGDKAMRVLKKAIEVYGEGRILSKEALEWLRARKERVKIEEEVDFESGYVVRVEGRKISTIPLINYLLNLIKEGRLQEALDLYAKAPKEWKEKMVKEVNLEKEYASALSDERYLKSLSKFLEGVKGLS